MIGSSWRGVGMAALAVAFFAAVMAASVVLAWSGAAPQEIHPIARAVVAPPELPRTPVIATAEPVVATDPEPTDDEVDDAEVDTAPLLNVPPVTELAPATNPVPSAPVSPLPDVARWTPAEMQSWLLRVPELALQDPASPLVAKTGRAYGRRHPVLSIIAARPDLRTLPIRPTVLSPAESDAFRDASVLLRKELSQLTGQVPNNPNTAVSRRLVIQPEVLTARPEVVARVLHQMLQVEHTPLRKALLTKLTRLKHPTATRTLAHRAVYEPVEELRQTAQRALEGRSPTDYLPVLFEALRSPWPAAAEHAADVLCSLTPQAAVAPLIALLDAPAPGDPIPNDRGVTTIRELVRINHSHNCILCHAQSANRGDNIRVLAPSPVRPLGSPFSLDGYEGGGRGGGGRSDPPGTVFVRPDVTYVTQDFSWVLPVANPGPWPALQRYDFVVRTRPAEPAEVAAGPSVGPSPQSLAVRRALRGITGKDFGPRGADWREALARN